MVVLSFLLFWLFGCHFFLLFGRGRASFFAVWAGARAPPKQQKKQTRPRPNSKEMNTPPPLPSVFFFAVWAAGRVFVFAVWARAWLCFCCLGGGRVFFPFWAGSCVLFLLFGRGTGVHSLTGLPGSSSSDPTTKKTKQQKQKKARVPVYRPKP